VTGPRALPVMYIPKHFAETRLHVLHQLIRKRPLSTLVTLSSGGLNANHIPLYLSDEPAPFGTLRGHVARANPVWKDLAADVEALAIFHGPQVYVTPSWYPTKAETGQVVPTWNYAVVHAWGLLRIIDDASWLQVQLEALTAQNEAGRPNPWSLKEAPQEFIEDLVKKVVGLEIGTTRLCGKWKLSQNQPPENRAGVVRGLRGEGTTDALEMASLIEGIEP